MKTYTITEEQFNIIKDAEKALKDYNELTAMGLGFNNSNLGFLSMFAPKIPEGADGPYPMGLKSQADLNKLINSLNNV